MKDPMERTREERMQAQVDLLNECAQTTRRACEEMMRIIDAGEFASGRADDQLAWFYNLKSRRLVILGEVMKLDGQREDRTGVSRRAEADRAWKGG